MTRGGSKGRRWLIVAATVLMLVPAPTASGQTGTPDGSIGIRLLEAPSNLSDDPRARLYVIDHLRQGETIRRRIELSSGLDHRMRLELYAGGAFVSKNGFGFLEGRTQNELSSWITVTPAAVDLPANGSATAQVTIAVPRDVADGERYAVVWAETPPSDGPGDVATIDRVGIRVYLSVGRGNAPAIDFRIEALTASRDDSGRPVVTATIVNTGGRAIDVTGTLRLSDGPGGLSAGPFPVQPGTIGIGGRAPVAVVLSKEIPDGPWTADLRLRSDLVGRRADARITFPSIAGETSTPVATGSSNLGWLLAIAAILLIATALWLFFALWRRRRDGSERNESHRPARPPTVRARV